VAFMTSHYNSRKKVPKNRNNDDLSNADINFDVQKLFQARPLQGIKPVHKA